MVLEIRYQAKLNLVRTAGSSLFLTSEGAGYVSSYKVSQLLFPAQLERFRQEGTIPSAFTKSQTGFTVHPQQPQPPTATLILGPRVSARFILKQRLGAPQSGPYLA